MRPALLLLFLVLPAFADLENKPVVFDLTSYQTISSEATKHKAKRLISIEQFNEMAKQKDTIILDARSQKAYQSIHIKGAKHLNFSDFTKQSLRVLIPDKNTRILIYCNNNFESTLPSLLDKRLPLALNMPTFLNLYGYGYHNIYELKDRLKQSDYRVEFAGSDASN